MEYLIKVFRDMCRDRKVKIVQETEGEALENLGEFFRKMES
jgi:hypothetical protein